MPPLDHQSVASNTLPEHDKLCVQCVSVLGTSHECSPYSMKWGDERYLNVSPHSAATCQLCRRLWHQFSPANQGQARQANDDSLEVAFRWLIRPSYLYGAYNLLFRSRRADDRVVESEQLTLGLLPLKEPGKIHMVEMVMPRR